MRGGEGVLACVMESGAMQAIVIREHKEWTNMS